MSERPGYWLVSLEESGAEYLRGLEVAARKGHLQIVKAAHPGVEIFSASHPGHGSICGAGLDVTGFVSGWFGPRQLLDVLYPLLRSGINVRIDPRVRHAAAIESVTAGVDPAALARFWLEFTHDFPVRDSRTQAGRAAALGLVDKLGAFVADRTECTVGLDELCAPIVQPSVVVRLEGRQPDHDGVVLGCHLDTTAGTPGGDDDASGVATLVEALRVIVVSKTRFLGHVYFVFHAAEEIGKYGAAQLARSFRTYGLPVGAMLQFDMTGCPDRTGKIYLNEDRNRINPHLNGKLANLIDDVLSRYGTTRGVRTIDYAASDHAWWASFGFPAAFPFESQDGNPYKHTLRDTRTDPAHMAHFARLAVAAAVEIAEPA